jgi:hypothetical protein
MTRTTTSTESALDTWITSLCSIKKAWATKNLDGSRKAVAAL